MMKRATFGVTLAATVLAGCTTTEMAAPKSKPASAPVAAAQPAKAVAKVEEKAPVKTTDIEQMIAGNAGRQIQIFNKDGKKVSEIPAGERGSVSIYTADKKGQDNYTFDAKGKITKHLRSYGADFAAGAWKEVTE